MSKKATLVPNIHLTTLKGHVSDLISGRWMFMHRHTCASLSSHDYACDCGLDVALEQAEKDVKRILKHLDSKPKKERK
jgi:hypothetical protein